MLLHLKELIRLSQSKQKSMCFAAMGRLQGRAAKLLLVRRMSWYSAGLLAICLTANGTAIGVVCVTGAANRPVVPFVGMKLSRWQAGMARYLQSRVRLVMRSRYDDASY